MRTMGETKRKYKKKLFTFRKATAGDAISGHKFGGCPEEFSGNRYWPIGDGFSDWLGIIHLCKSKLRAATGVRNLK
jgi:hypothetical protein